MKKQRSWFSFILMASLGCLNIGCILNRILNGEQLPWLNVVATSVAFAISFIEGRNLFLKSDGLGGE